MKYKLRQAEFKHKVAMATDTTSPHLEVQRKAENFKLEMLNSSYPSVKNAMTTDDFRKCILQWNGFVHVCSCSYSNMYLLKML